MTGTLLGVIFGLLLTVALCVAIWIFVIGRKRREIAEDAGGDYETEIESAGEFRFETGEQFESCDGGTNFDQDENEFLDQGFDANLFGNAQEEAHVPF
jgi:hypothetical protein